MEAEKEACRADGTACAKALRWKEAKWFKEPRGTGSGVGMPER